MGPNDVMRQPEVDWEMMKNIIEEGDVVDGITRTVNDRIDRAEEVMNDVVDFFSDLFS